MNAAGHRSGTAISDAVGFSGEFNLDDGRYFEGGAGEKSFVCANEIDWRVAAFVNPNSVSLGQFDNRFPGNPSQQTASQRRRIEFSPLYEEDIRRGSLRQFAP